METDESEIKTAQREIFEETGLEVQFINGFKKKITYYPFAEVIKDVIYFLAIPKNEQIILQTSEINDFQWTYYDKAMQIVTYDNEKAVLKAAYQFIKSSRR